MDDLEKLKRLLQHWMEHNNAHVKTYSEWAERASDLGRPELALIINNIAEESRKLDELFRKAGELL